MKASDKLKKYAEQINKIDPKKFDFLLEEIPRIIKVRTRLGKGLLGKLKELSPNYIKIRKADSKLSKDTTFKRSNLTRTGEMLDSIVGKRSGNLFTFFFANKDADKKAYWADQTGRPFFDLLPSERNGLQRRISAIMRESIRAIFKG